jgi:glutamate synthase domain-containing protein 1
VTTPIAPPTRRTPAPPSRGLYRPELEHDACGVSFVVDIKGRASHEIVRKGITALNNLEHRARRAPR